jgi:large subunit ribosomal protein L21
MYAIVEIAGQQFKVEEGKKIFVNRLELEDGKKVEFDQVLLIEDEGKIVIGEPVIKNAVVEGKILEQLRGDKVIVFKKKRKKGYRIKNGHRQYFTQVEIVSIKEKGIAKKTVTTKEEILVSEPKVESETKSEEKVVEKKPAAKKVAPKKVTEKSVPAKKSAVKKETAKPAEKKVAAKKPVKGKAE